EKIISNLQNVPTDKLYSRFFDTARLELIDFPTMLERIKNQQVVYVGETHNNESHHQLQLNILKEIHKHNSQVAVGMEFLYRPQEKDLNRYSREQSLSDEELKTMVAAGFGDVYPMYVPILKFARDNRLIIKGLNVSRGLKKKMTEVGWDNLTDGEKKLIARDIDTSNQAHREFVLKAFQNGMMKMGVMPESMMDKFYLSQCVWDETMAESVANYFKEVNNPSAQMIVIAGNGHIKYKFNIPERAAKRYQLTYKTLIPCEINDSQSLTNEMLDLTMGDFIFFSPPAPPEEEKMMGR
ncbi:MAG: ChaN family lipoprotein, partial [Planctomycetota bacterium]